MTENESSNKAIDPAIDVHMVSFKYLADLAINFVPVPVKFFYGPVQ